MGGVPQQVGTVWGVCPTENFIKAVSNEGMLDYPAPPLATPGTPPGNARNTWPRGWHRVGEVPSPWKMGGR